MADVVEAALDVALQYPSRVGARRELREATFDSICTTARLSESVRGVVRRGFRYWVESQQV